MFVDLWIQELSEEKLRNSAFIGETTWNRSLPLSFGMNHWRHSMNETWSFKELFHWRMNLSFENDILKDWNYGFEASSMCKQDSPVIKSCKWLGLSWMKSRPFYSILNLLTYDQKFQTNLILKLSNMLFSKPKFISCLSFKFIYCYVFAALERKWANSLILQG